MKSLIANSLSEALEKLQEFVGNPDTVVSIEIAAKEMAETLRAGNKIISCGNGGSLCDATHFAEELTGKYRNDRQPLPAISINDPAFLTCVGNDYDFNTIFARYVKAFGISGDNLLAISTSGNSENIIQAVLAAKEVGMKTIALTQTGKNKLSQIADITLAAPKASHSDRIQEIHIKIIHILIQAIEYNLNLGGK